MSSMVETDNSMDMKGSVSETWFLLRRSSSSAAQPAGMTAERFQPVTGQGKLHSLLADIMGELLLVPKSELIACKEGIHDDRFLDKEEVKG